ncbi:MAG TPA: hypothetical protein VMX57_02725 [Planctomycetota bacterium]|nr:hypothetical protein [Planctomycetota bacterium]
MRRRALLPMVAMLTAFTAMVLVCTATGAQTREVELKDLNVTSTSPAKPEKATPEAEKKPADADAEKEDAAP